MPWMWMKSHDSQRDLERDSWFWVHQFIYRMKWQVNITSSSSSSHSSYLHLRQKKMTPYLKTNQHLFCKFLRRTHSLIFKSLIKIGKWDKHSSIVVLFASLSDRSCYCWSLGIKLTIYMVLLQVNQFVSNINYKIAQIIRPFS